MIRSIISKEYAEDCHQQDEQVFSPQGLSPTVIMSLTRAWGLTNLALEQAGTITIQKLLKIEGADLAGAVIRHR